MNSPLGGGCICKVWSDRQQHVGLQVKILLCKSNSKSSCVEIIHFNFNSESSVTWSTLDKKRTDAVGCSPLLQRPMKLVAKYFERFLASIRYGKSWENLVFCLLLCPWKIDWFPSADLLRFVHSFTRFTRRIYIEFTLISSFLPC